ncbi:MAG TPA: PEGA domain-containing protein [Candidatus Omnitrophica bacterium]|nr:PEGA domain-containing protein [Candidatus Omnitrophota bacterium]
MKESEKIRKRLTKEKVRAVLEKVKREQSEAPSRSTEVIPHEESTSVIQHKAVSHEDQPTYSKTTEPKGSLVNKINPTPPDHSPASVKTIISEVRSIAVKTLSWFSFIVLLLCGFLGFYYQWWFSLTVAFILIFLAGLVVSYQLSVVIERKTGMSIEHLSSIEELQGQNPTLRISAIVTIMVLLLITTMVLIRPKSITVKTNPPGAKIYLDGREIGLVSPGSIKITAGTYTVRAEKEGHEFDSVRIKVGLFRISPPSVDITGRVINREQPENLEKLQATCLSPTVSTEKKLTAYKRIASYYMRKGNEDSAKSHLQKALRLAVLNDIELNVDEEEELSNLFLAVKEELWSQKYREVEKELQERIVEAYTDLDKLKETATTYPESLKMWKESNNLLQKAQKFLNLGRYEAARKSVNGTIVLTEITYKRVEELKRKKSEIDTKDKLDAWRALQNVTEAFSQLEEEIEHRMVKEYADAEFEIIKYQLKCAEQSFEEGKYKDTTYLTNQSEALIAKAKGRIQNLIEREYISPLEISLKNLRTDARKYGTESELVEGDKLLEQAREFLTKDKYRSTLRKIAKAEEKYLKVRRIIEDAKNQDRKKEIIKKVENSIKSIKDATALITLSFRSNRRYYQIQARGRLLEVGEELTALADSEELSSSHRERIREAIDKCKIRNRRREKLPTSRDLSEAKDILINIKESMEQLIKRTLHEPETNQASIL